MYFLQKINPSDWQQIPTLSNFYDDLAKKPYCTNEKGTCCPRIKSHAIKQAYIQPNHPQLIKWLVFDIDNENALFSYHDNSLPRPQIIIRNPENGHAHYCYRLTFPVPMWKNANFKPIEYLGAVYKALNKVLGADPSYNGNLIKNPANTRHQTYLTGAAPSYSLEELAEFLDLNAINADLVPQNEDYFGRNCSVFHRTRAQAYKIADQHSEADLLKKVLAIAQEENAKFDSVLLPNEVNHIARSITRYCKSARFKQYQKQSVERFSKLQAHRGRSGGKASRRKPVATSEATTKPWEALGISRRTYYYKNKNK